MGFLKYEKLTKTVLCLLDPAMVFETMVSAGFYETAARETNRYADQSIAAATRKEEEYRRKVEEQRRLVESGVDPTVLPQLEKPRPPDKSWKPVTAIIMRLFFGIFIALGVTRIQTLRDVWSNNDLLSIMAIKKRISRDRFVSILRYLHLVNNEIDDGTNKLFKLGSFLESMKYNFRTFYKPERYLSVDEAMIGFKGRLSFRQFMPAKPVKYGRHSLEGKSCPFRT